MKKAVVVIPVYRVFTPTEAFAFCQCVDVLGSHPISVICPKNLDVSFIDGFRKNIDIDYVRFEPKYFEGIKGYNNLLLTPSFYERFADYEYMLIYQLDAFVFHDSLNYWVDKGYAVPVTLPERRCGLRMRRCTIVSETAGSVCGTLPK